MHLATEEDTQAIWIVSCTMYECTICPSTRPTLAQIRSLPKGKPKTQDVEAEDSQHVRAEPAEADAVNQTGFPPRLLQAQR